MALFQVPFNQVLATVQRAGRFKAAGLCAYAAGMNKLKNLVWNVGQAIQLIWQLFRYAVTFFLALL